METSRVGTNQVTTIEWCVTSEWVDGYAERFSATNYKKIQMFACDHEKDAYLEELRSKPTCVAVNVKYRHVTPWVSETCYKKGWVPQ